MNNAIKNILEQLQELHHGKPWIGRSLEFRLAQLDPDKCFVRPIPDMHSIAEILSHVTLWRTEAILKINTGSGSKTDDCPENWLSNEALQSKGWDHIKTAYDASLEELITLLQQKDDNFLDRQYYDTDFKGDYTYRWLLNGMVEHDAYHLGQIGMIIKYLKLKQQQ